MTMAEMTWEKSPEKVKVDLKQKRSGERVKFIIGGLLILAAIGVLVFSSTVSGARFFIMVDDVVGNPEYVGQTVRLTGAVVGETINYDPETGTLIFSIAGMPAEYEDLAQTLHLSANDVNATRLVVHMDDTSMPDLLSHEAQAIITGSMGEDGIFYASELNLKCPSRFEEHTPDMLESSMG
ncbi:MAG: cytochrome c maturation protein CcmE [Anaerolineae bacterium]|nr:cytochrome c maturation protein CcmE [Anaerolineae bacterium]